MGFGRPVKQRQLIIATYEKLRAQKHKLQTLQKQTQKTQKEIHKLQKELEKHRTTYNNTNNFNLHLGGTK